MKEVKRGQREPKGRFSSGGGFKGKGRGGWENSRGGQCGQEWQGVWEAVVSGESQFLYPSHSCRHTPAWSLQDSTTSLTCPTFSGRRRDRGSGELSPASPSPCHGRTKWGTGSSPAPNSQAQGSHHWADVTAGLQPDPESVFIPTP